MSSEKYTEIKRKDKLLYIFSFIGLIWFLSFFLYKLITESFASFVQLGGIMLMFSVFKNKRRLIKYYKVNEILSGDENMVPVEQLTYRYSDCDENNRIKLCFTNNSSSPITNLWIEATPIQNDQTINFHIKTNTLPKQTSFTEAQCTDSELTFHKISYTYFDTNNSAVAVEYDFDTETYNTNFPDPISAEEERSISKVTPPKDRKWLSRIAFTYFFLSLVMTILFTLSSNK